MLLSLTYLPLCSLGIRCSNSFPSLELGRKEKGGANRANTHFRRKKNKARDPLEMEKTAIFPYSFVDGVSDVDQDKDDQDRDDPERNVVPAKSHTHTHVQ